MMDGRLRHGTGGRVILHTTEAFRSTFSPRCFFCILGRIGLRKLCLGCRSMVRRLGALCQRLDKVRQRFTSVAWAKRSHSANTLMPATIVEGGRA